MQPRLAAVTGECSATIAEAPTTTDNCAGTITGTTTDPLSYTNQGDYTITWTFDDKNGNVTTATQLVSVKDVTKPVITTPAAIAVNTPAGQCGAALDITAPAASDNCSVGAPTGSRSDSRPLTEAFPVGTTTITWTVTDANGNQAEPVTQTVTVTDNMKPTITAPTDLIVSANASCQASDVILGTPVTSDNCGVKSVTNDAKQTFQLGPNTVTWTVTDVNGNQATATQTVTVVDQTAPTIVGTPANITVAAGANCQATVNFTAPTATDNCGSVTLTSTHEPGAIFALGTTTVTYTATDGTGNQSSASFTVTVEDKTAPVVTVPANITVNNDADACGAVVTYQVSATDNCSTVTPERTEGLASGEVFPIGTTTVTYAAKDAAGNETTQSFTVTVLDNKAPVLTLAADQTSGTDKGTCSATMAIPDATFSDNCAGSKLSWTLTGATTGNGHGQVGTRAFNQGVTTITYTATDGAGNTITDHLTVTVTDNEAPVLTAPEAVQVAANSQCQATGVNLGLAKATDNCSATVKVTNNAPTTFSLGTTTVTYTAIDEAGNTTTATQIVTVTDNTKPVIATPAAIAVNTPAGQCGAALDIKAPAASDNCSVGAPTGSRSDSRPLTEAFPVGTTTITWTVTDANGNQAEPVTQTVTVTDNIKPTLTSVPADVTINACSAVAKERVITSLATATDNCTYTITNDAPANFPIGQTTVTWTATDATGNTATATQLVTIVDIPKPVFEPLVFKQGTSVLTAPNVPVGTFLTVEAPIKGSSLTATAELQTSSGISIKGATKKISEANGVTRFGFDFTSLPTVGVYKLHITAINLGCATETLTYEYVVVFDEGMVTGGGWINSPAGALRTSFNTATPATELTGKANFGFVGKNQKGANVPTGNTEFQFHAGSMNFKSTKYDWLVVSGTTKAQFKGEGTINGAGWYGFVLTAEAGGINVGKFRIKIVNKANGSLVYDNADLSATASATLSADETSLAGHTLIQGGSINIHNSSVKTTSKTTSAVAVAKLPVAAKARLTSYPNPMTDEASIEFSVAQDGEYSLDIFDLKGALVKHVQKGKAVAGETIQAKWDARATKVGMYIIRVSTGSNVQTLRVVRQ
ncbi:HYR domain-containing protein [Rufibacter psychrotolerans]|uniref:HYR domain-containing protein n=1 Tax=Rufibacter psychrotolerans TaxID=2812556 RepID=UPI001967208A|nr:HYR domain-containing protein [Rufibacter sp. SYSU D00308]